MTLVSELKGDLCIVTNALQKIKKDDKRIDEETEDDEDVQDFLLKEITNLSRRNSDTQLHCELINQENKENQDSNKVDSTAADLNEKNDESDKNNLTLKVNDNSH